MFQRELRQAARLDPVPERVYQALVKSSGPFQPYLAMVEAAEGESVFDYREAAEQLLMSVAEINRAQLRALRAPRARMRPSARRRCRRFRSRCIARPARPRARAPDLLGLAVSGVAAGPGLPDHRRQRRLRRVHRASTAKPSSAATSSSFLARGRPAGNDREAQALRRRRRARRRADAERGPPDRRARASSAGIAPPAASSSGEDGAPLYLAVLQDTTSEHAARDRADRSVRELDDWFDLSPVGMVLFDDSGLLVRTNPAFDEMAGGVPVSLAEGEPEPRAPARRGARAARSRACTRARGRSSRRAGSAQPGGGAPAPARDRALLPHRGGRAPLHGHRRRPQRRRRARPGARPDRRHDGHRRRRHRHLRGIVGLGAPAQRQRLGARRCCRTSVATSSRPNRWPSTSGCSWP